MKRPLVSLTLLLLVATASAQTKNGNAIASGQCSIAISGNNNTVTSAALADKRCSIDKEQIDQIVTVLNAVFTKRDASQIKAKLDELLALALKPSQINIHQECPGGICNGGSNSGTQTVVNNSPPPATLYYDMQGDQLWLSPMSPITGAIIGLFFSAPTEPDYGDLSHMGPYLHDENAGMTQGPQFGWNQMVTNRTLIPNAYVMTLSNPPVFMPSMQLIVRLRGGKLLKICNMSAEHECLTTAFEAPQMNPLNRVKP